MFGIEKHRQVAVLLPPLAKGNPPTMESRPLLICRPAFADRSVLQHGKSQGPSKVKSDSLHVKVGGARGMVDSN